MVPHVAARKAYQPLSEFSFATPKRLLQQYLPLVDMIEPVDCTASKSTDRPVRDLRVFAEMDCNSSKVFSVVISLDSEGHPLTAKTPAKLAGGSDSTGDIRKTADTSPPTRGQARRSTGRAEPDLRSGRPGPDPAARRAAGR